MARAENITKQRRRRDDDGLQGARRRLPPVMDRDEENFEYRYINGTPERIHQMTVQDDWDIVSDRDSDTGGMGSEVAVHAGTTQRGDSFNAVLVRKPKNFYKDDQMKAQRRIDDLESSIRSGKPQGGQDDGSSYVPDNQQITVDVGTKT